MDREKETLDIIQGLIDLAKSMQEQINKLNREMTELQNQISGRAK